MQLDLFAHSRDVMLRNDFPHFIPFREFRQLYTAVETESQLGPEWLIPKPPDD